MKMKKVNETIVNPAAKTVTITATGSLASIFEMGVTKVKSGTKTSNGTTIPQLSLMSQRNKFKINHAAAKAFGLVEGQKVILFVTKSSDINTKFVLAIARQDDGTAAKLALANSAKKDTTEPSALLFNYSVVYDIMYQNDVTAEGVDMESLISSGHAVKHGAQYYCDRVITYNMIKHDGSININGENFSELYLLDSPQVEVLDLTKMKAPTRKAKVEPTDKAKVEPTDKAKVEPTDGVDAEPTKVEPTDKLDGMDDVPFED